MAAVTFKNLCPPGFGQFIFLTVPLKLSQTGWGVSVNWRLGAYTLLPFHNYSGHYILLETLRALEMFLILLLGPVQFLGHDACVLSDLQQGLWELIYTGVFVCLSKQCPLKYIFPRWSKIRMHMTTIWSHSKVSEYFCKLILLFGWVTEYRLMGRIVILKET